MICIRKTNTNKNIDMQIDLILNDSSWKSQQAFGYIKVKINRAPPTNKKNPQRLSVEIMKWIVKCLAIEEKYFTSYQGLFSFFTYKDEENSPVKSMYNSNNTSLQNSRKKKVAGYNGRIVMM